MWEEAGEIVLWMVLSAILGLVVGYLLARVAGTKDDDDYASPAYGGLGSAAVPARHASSSAGLPLAPGHDPGSATADLEAQLARARAEIERLRERPVAPSQRPEDAAKIAALEQRLTASEAQAGGSASRVEGLEAEVTRLVGELDTRDDRIALLMHPSGPHAAASAGTRQSGSPAASSRSASSPAEAKPRAPKAPAAPAKPVAPAGPEAPKGGSSPPPPASPSRPASPSSPSRPPSPSSPSRPSSPSPSQGPAAANPDKPAPVGSSTGGGASAGGDIESIEGVGPSFGNRLRQAGITTIARLLEQGATAEGRATLAAATAIREGLILTWVNHADLMRVPGIDPQAAELLEAGGVDSPVELARRNPANLAATLAETNAEQRLSGGSPTEAMLGVWIKAAAELPKLVEH